MKTTYVVASNRKDFKKQTNSTNTISDKTYLNCVIANDATKKLDFLLLVIETIQINATDSLLLTAKNIGFADDFTTRVQFWKMRCSNPFRKSYTFSSLSSDQVDSLVEIISIMADNIYPLIRQLLSSKESKSLNKERWFLFSKRLKSLIRERMNLQRSYINSLLTDDNNEFFRELLVILSLSCGKGGANRLKASLYNHY